MSAEDRRNSSIEEDECAGRADVFFDEDEDRRALSNAFQAEYSWRRAGTTPGEEETRLSEFDYFERMVRNAIFAEEVGAREAVRDAHRWSKKHTGEEMNAIGVEGIPHEPDHEPCPTHAGDEEATVLPTHEAAESSPKKNQDGGTDSNVEPVPTSNIDAGEARTTDGEEVDRSSASRPTDIPEAMLDLIGQMEVMVRCMVLQDEQDAFLLLRTSCAHLVALQRFHEGVSLLKEQESQMRFVVGAQEGYAWYSLEVDAAALYGAAVGNPQDRTGEEAVADPEEGAEPAAAVLNNTNAEGAPSIAPAETPPPVVSEGHGEVSDPPLFTDEEIASEALVAEVSEVLGRFVSDARTQIEEDELEARDVMNIEMELDRDELNSIASKATQVVRDDRGNGHLDEIRHSSADRVLARMIERHSYDGLVHNDACNAADVYRNTVADIPPVTAHEPLHHPQQPLEGALLLQVTSAELYERQSIAKLRGMMWRHTTMAADRMMAAHHVEDDYGASDTWQSIATCVALEWEEALDELWVSHTRSHSPLMVPSRLHVRPPGLLQLDERVLGEHHTDDAAERTEHTQGNESVARQRDVIPRSGSACAAGGDHHEAASRAIHVPDAARLGRVVSPSDEAPNIEKDVGDMSDDEVEAAYRQVRLQQQLRDITTRLLDVEVDEIIERELLFASADDERRGIVHIFASCMAEEFDWSLGGYSVRLRRMPLLVGTPRPAQPLVLPTTDAVRTAEGALQAMVKPKERHLPLYMRTPAPPSRSSGRASTTVQPSYLPSPPPAGSLRFSRLGGERSGHLSSGMSGGPGSRSVSRVTDLMYLTSRGPSKLEGGGAFARMHTPYRGTLVNVPQAPLTV